MSNYRRFWRPGGTYFLTQVTAERRPFLCDQRARDILRNAIIETGKSRPFAAEAIVLLPDHFHAIWRMPEGDRGYSLRMAAVKARFTKAWRLAGGAEAPRGASHVLRRERGVWQRRFWEHTCRDEEDFKNHLDYVHWNPVKHGYVTCPHLWPYSTFDKWVRFGVYAPDWRCVCEGRTADAQDFSALNHSAME